MHLITIKYFLVTLSIIIVYVATALLGFEFASIKPNVTMIWMPSGVALAGILYFGYRYLLAIFIGAVIANIFSDIGIFSSLLIALGNTSEAFVASWIINFFFKSHLTIFDSPRYILVFCIAVICGAFAAALNGATVLAMQVLQNWEQFYEIMSIWWLGDAMGMLLITPTLLLWAQPPYNYPLKVIKRNLFFFSLVILTLLLSFGGLIQHFGGSNHIHPQYPLAFIPMAALLITALFCGPKLVSLTIISSTALIINGTLSGHGPFVKSAFEESMALIYLFILISTLCTFIVSYLVRQRNMAQEELRIGSERLDLVMQGTEDGVWDWNVETDEVYFSPTLKKMIGFSENELPGHFSEWRNRLHPEDKGKTLELLYNHRDGKSAVYQSEYRLRCKNGDYLWILGRGKGVKYSMDGKAMRIVGTHVNLMAQKKKEAELQIASRVIQTTPEGVMITSPDNIIIDVNPAFTKTTGYSRDEVIGQKPSLLSSGRQDSAFYKKMWANIDSVGFWQGEIWNRRKNGEIFPEWMHISAIKSENGQVIQYAAIFSDIGNQERLKKELHNFAYYDALTSIPNRDLFIDRLNITLQQMRKNKGQLAILLIDLDRFKVINETLGHTVGDALLQEVAKLLKLIIREGDTIARMGGDEFAILLPATSSVDKIARIAENILENFKNSFIIHKQEIHITCSIGITIFTQDGDNVDELIKNVDTSMYQAKGLGFNKYSFYHTNMSADFHERFQLESQLRYAVERDELFLEYQPQHNISDGSLTGMEALVRWKHPELGSIPPSKFIPIAEETGLIISIGDWVLKQAIEDSLSICEQFPSDFRVSINLSVLQIQQPDLVEFINNTLVEIGLPHHYVELEITESMLMKNIDDTLLKLNELADLGIKIAIDDFGTGYSSLSYLNKFPISKLKIDKSFVDDVCNKSDDAEIASTIIAMGHNLHMKVIAEGVEDSKQLAFLKSQGCDEVQGYYYSRPLLFEQFIEYLMRKTKQ